jgi:gliding motility-associated-like protein
MSMKKKTAFGVILFFPVFLLISQIKINEYSCSNLSINTDNFGQYEDWIELYNPTAAPVSLSGFYLSDALNKPTKYQLGAGVSIPANGFLLIWASGRNITTGANLHASFKLTQTKPEKIILRDASLNIIDSITLVPTQKNHSYGRSTNGASTWSVFSTPTPGTSNNTQTPRNYCPRPVMSHTAGFYASPISVNITIPSGYTVHYTTNGSTPTTLSPVYSAPISVNTTSVIRARAFSNNPNELPSFLESNTYFINVSHSVAVISVFGDQIQTLLAGSQIEPETGLEYFDKNKIFKAESYGLSNKHGNDSWSYPQRGIDFISYDQFGYNYCIKNKLFPNSNRKEFQRIILKAGASDNYPFECPAAGNPFAWGNPTLLDGAHIRDAFVQTLSQKANLHLDERTWSPCVLYRNGAYWGVYEIREKVDDEDYMEYYYDVTEDSLYYLKTWGGTWADYGGTNAINDWNNTRNFIVNNSMANQANYNQAISMLDEKSLADYIIINSLSVNADWLNWNTSWWRGRNLNGKNKRWRYTLWDMDATFKHYINYTGIPNMNANADPCDPQSLPNPGNQGHIPIFNALLQNPNFKQYYIMRYFDLLNNGLSCQRMVTVLDSMINQIDPEMTQHCAKWGGTYNAWKSNYQALRNFILERCDSVVNGFAGCYNTTGPYKIKVNVDPPNSGQVQVNSLLINNFVWSANYPGNLNMIFKAVPNPGYCFDQWVLVNHTVSPNANNDSVTVNLNNVDSIVAKFIPAQFTPTITAPVPYICSGSNVQLQLQGAGNATVQWTSPANLSCNSCTNPVVTTTVSTSVSVTVQGNCKYGSSTYFIQVYPKPNLEVPFEDTIICKPSSIRFSALSTSNSFTWEPSNKLNCSLCPKPETSPEETTIFTVSSATDPQQICLETKTIHVVVEGPCPEIYIPTGFSPNGDNNNDYFRAFGKVNKFHIVIFNRWGEKVFETNDIEQAWDGKYQGEYVPSGVYAFVVNGIDYNGKPIHKTGNITVIR